MPYLSLQFHSYRFLTRSGTWKICMKRTECYHWVLLLHAVTPSLTFGKASLWIFHSEYDVQLKKVPDASQQSIWKWNHGKSSAPEAWHASFCSVLESSLAAGDCCQPWSSELWQKSIVTLWRAASKARCDTAGTVRLSSLEQVEHQLCSRQQEGEQQAQSSCCVN